MGQDWKGYIEVTEVDPRLLIQVAFSGSRPQGMGFLHHTPGGLAEEELNGIMEHAKKYDGDSISLDYVRGRSMKFHIRSDKETGKRYIDLDWYDHSRDALKRLVRECGVPDVEDRIAHAEKEKEEKQAAFEAREQAGAQLFVNILAGMGGTCRSNEAPFKGYYNLKDGDHTYEAWAYGREKAVKLGWVLPDDEYRVFTLTGTGRDAVTTTQELPTT